MYRNALRKLRQWKPLYLLHERLAGDWGQGLPLRENGRLQESALSIDSSLLLSGFLLSRRTILPVEPGMLRIADLHWELSQGQVAIGFWVPSLLILEAETSRPGQMQTGGG